MKRVFIVVYLGAFWLAPALWGRVPCRVAARPQVEVLAASVSAADLLMPGSCPELLGPASRVRLGAPPLRGIVRVMEGSKVRALLQDVVRSQRDLLDRQVIFEIPERVSVRRGGPHASCADIQARLSAGSAGMLPTIGSTPDAAEDPSTIGSADCGPLARIPRDAALELMRQGWDPATRTWELFARCVHEVDCVPFVVRVPPGLLPQGETPGNNADIVPRRSDVLSRTASRMGTRTPVGPGQRITLVWQQDGIRLTIRAVCLEAGNAGEVVRVRLARGRVLRALVLPDGGLRAIS